MRKEYRWVALGFVCIIAIVFGVFWMCSKTTVLLVRHSNKATTAANTNLSQTGLDRALALVATAADAGVKTIYSTEYCRTAQTAQPLALALNLPLHVQQDTQSGSQLANSECEPDIDASIVTLPAAINTTDELADEIVSANRGKVVLVVGHSNTVPDLVEALGAPPLCPEYFPLDSGDCRIPDDQYDNLFIVTIPRFIGSVTIVRARYGQ